MWVLFSRKSSLGFTILELLVVIAIISILSAVILVALSASRGKGRDAAIKAQLYETRSQAQLYFENMGKYCVEGASPPECLFGELNGSPANCNQDSTVFDNDFSPNPYTIGAFISAANDNAPGGSIAQCFMDANGTKWVATIQLNNIAGGRWCIDSSGNSKVLLGSYSTVQGNVNAAGKVCP